MSLCAHKRTPHALDCKWGLRGAHRYKTSSFAYCTSAFYAKTTNLCIWLSITLISNPVSHSLALSSWVVLQDWTVENTGGCSPLNLSGNIIYARAEGAFQNTWDSCSWGLLALALVYARVAREVVSHTVSSNPGKMTLSRTRIFSRASCTTRGNFTRAPNARARKLKVFTDILRKKKHSKLAQNMHTGTCLWSCFKMTLSWIRIFCAPSRTQYKTRCTRAPKARASKIGAFFIVAKRKKPVPT